MKIVNLTQHPATKEQIEAGVYEPANKDEVKKVLTFTEIPTKDEMVARAKDLAQVAVKEGADAAMIGGAPYFMGTLEEELKKVGVKPLYAFTQRVTVEVQKDDGTVEKKAVFKFEGWVEV